MEHSANIHYPNTSPMWCNVNTAPMSSSINSYDGMYWYHWCPHDRWYIWYDTPMVEGVIDGNVCYRLTGNVWICSIPSEIPMTPNVVPYPESLSSTGNVKPSITITTAKMENHAEHVSVMFGQIISNLK